MTFDPNIPNAGDKLSNSQPVLKSNNISLNTQFGLEHDALNGGAGKHKFVTLRQIPPLAAPLPPIGTDIIMKKTLVGSTWYTEFLDSSGNIWFIPLRRMFKPPQTTTIPHNAGVDPVLDFNNAAFAIPDSSSGTIHLYDNHPGDYDRSIFTTYVWVKPNLYISGGQLTAGSIFNSVKHAGSVLQLDHNTLPYAGTTTVTLILTQSITT